MRCNEPCPTISSSSMPVVGCWSMARTRLSRPPQNSVSCTRLVSRRGDPTESRRTGCVWPGVLTSWW
ncbi:hypothetical protein PNF1_1230 (plasmid) [Nocardia farcinica IFM 10152]|uniref:Uncharacterized protein n=1 Tax=Nocardia farcinica (strain IFM 10152) TaxID=247156 RepID=Q5YME3_NOCFA|nr:hypothetical protein PNF1_1230 [Nocardia farcinica IFM 10152]